MPTIVFASPKGGCGKSTSAVLLAAEMAGRGGSVTLIDADPNHPVSKWARRPGKPDLLNVIDHISEQTIIDEIEKAEKQTAFVIVDLEGTASAMVGYAISRAELVIIPAQASQLDAAEAVKAIGLIKHYEKVFRRTIPFSVLLTRTSAAIRSRGLASIEAEFRQNGIPLFSTRIMEREAYKALFAFGGTLATLDSSQVSNINGAMANARAFAAEVVAILRRNAARAA